MHSVTADKGCRGRAVRGVSGQTIHKKNALDPKKKEKKRQNASALKPRPPIFFCLPLSHHPPSFPRSIFTPHATQIRFTRLGRKRKPFYRIIAIDSRKRRDGAPLEVRQRFSPPSTPLPS